MVNIATLVLAAVCAVLTYFTASCSYKFAVLKGAQWVFDGEQGHSLTETVSVGAKAFTKARLSSGKGPSFLSYDRLYAWLKKNGRIVPGMMEDTPEAFVLTSLVFSLVIAAIVLIAGFGVPVAVVAAVAATVFRPMRVKAENKADNEAMAEDISNMYGRLSMQLSSNVHVTDAFYDCYYYTSNRRLKRALLELDAQVKVTHDLTAALEDFQGKFDNPEIDSLARIIRGAADAGNLSRTLDEMKRETYQLQESANYRYKEGLDRKMTIINLLVFALVVVIMVYLMMMSFSSELSGLFSLS